MPPDMGRTSSGNAVAGETNPVEGYFKDAQIFLSFQQRQSIFIESRRNYYFQERFAEQFSSDKVDGPV
jgi:hypothetical protein